MAGRQARVPRVASLKDKTTTPLYRLHADVCGPMQTESISGKRYFLIVVDEATRFSVLTPITCKSEVETVLPDVFLKLQKLIVF
jgi:hypothetical protein